MDANDGGPAFPTPDTYHPSGQVQHGCYGMTLRDWFAGQALVGWIASTRDPEASAWDATWWARKAYETADAMLKAREAKP
jgi:hypothetical protein